MVQNVGRSVRMTSGRKTTLKRRNVGVCWKVCCLYSRSAAVHCELLHAAACIKFAYATKAVMRVQQGLPHRRTGDAWPKRQDGQEGQGRLQEHMGHGVLTCMLKWLGCLLVGEQRAEANL